MSEREQELRSASKWNRRAVYFDLGVALFNALLGNLFWVVCLGLALLNWRCHRYMEQVLEEEGYNDLT